MLWLSLFTHNICSRGPRAQKIPNQKNHRQCHYFEQNLIHIAFCDVPVVTYISGEEFALSILHEIC